MSDRRSRCRPPIDPAAVRQAPAVVDPRTRLAYALARHGLSIRIYGKEAINARSQGGNALTIRVDAWAAYWDSGDRIAYTDETDTVIRAVTRALSDLDSDISHGPLHYSTQA